MKARHPFQGPNLRHYRELLGLSMRDLAKRVPCSASTIGNWENGKTELEYQDALNLSEALGIPVQMLWDHIDASMALRRPTPQEPAPH